MITSVLLGIIANQFCFETGCDADWISSTLNIVLTLLKWLNTNRQAVNIQHACCSHKNAIVNENNYN